MSRAGVEAAIDTNEPNVRSLLTKIEAGELDAGIVYMTDVRSASGELEGIEIPDAVNVAADYPIAVIVEGPNTVGGRAFVDFVMSGVGQEILAGFGFVTP
jgi:molybdate transport system substrate-binding protein